MSCSKEALPGRLTNRCSKSFGSKSTVLVKPLLGMTDSNSDEIIDRTAKRLKALEDYYDYCILERMMKDENIAAAVVGNPAKHSPEVLEKIGMDILAMGSQLKNRRI